MGWSHHSPAQDEALLGATPSPISDGGQHTV